MPPTTAHNTVENAIHSIQLQDSTAIGEGIASALSALRQAPKDPNDPDAVGPGAIVLLTDGKNTIGRAPLQAAARPGPPKVPIYTIAYGTENGYVELDGKREPVPVDHEAMKEIAELTEGATSRRRPPTSSRRSTRTSAPSRLREGRPRGHLPVRRLRSRPGRAGRPRSHLLGSKVAVIVIVAAPPAWTASSQPSALARSAPARPSTLRQADRAPLGRSASTPGGHAGRLVPSPVEVNE